MCSKDSQNLSKQRNALLLHNAKRMFHVIQYFTATRLSDTEQQTEPAQFETVHFA